MKLSFVIIKAFITQQFNFTELLIFLCLQTPVNMKKVDKKKLSAKIPGFAFFTNKLLLLILRNFYQFTVNSNYSNILHSLLK